MPKRSWFTAAAAADGRTADIAIYDEIGHWGVTAKDFRDALEALGPVDTINLRINSPGGEVFDGIAVHNMLARSKATVNVTVDGLAASIASLIAMAGDQVTMPENAMMMVHDPSGIVMGTAADMQDMADALDKISTAMAATYARKTGQTPEAIAQIMDAETWLTAAEAKELGFADEVTPPARISARFDVQNLENLLAHAPAEVAKQLRAAYDPDGDGDDDALEAIGYIGQAIDALADAVGCLTGTGDDDDEPGTAPGVAPGAYAAIRKALTKRRELQELTAAASNWTVGAARDLPIDKADSWDGPAAAERMLDAAGFNGESPDSAKARRGFLVYDASAPKRKGSYKLPFADLIGGELRAMEGGLNAAASRLPQTDIPDDVKTGARAVIDAYDKRRDDAQNANATAKLAADIAAHCDLAGEPQRAAEYILSGKSLAEVRSELQAIRLERGRPRDGSQEISARRDPLAGHDMPAMTSWAKTLDKLNAKQGRAA
jgi:ATP-dependent Clp protease protease subunit